MIEGDMTDEDLVGAADHLFQALDAEEDGNAQP